MTTIQETETPAVPAAVVEQSPPTMEEAVAKVEDKPAVKEKKPRTPKEKKPKQPTKTATHPPYFQMIKDALLALNDRSGSSPYAIAKYMEKKHKTVLPENFKKILGLQLKNSTARGKLIKIKASYKLAEAKQVEKKVPSVMMTRSSTTKKPRTPKKTRSVNKVEFTAPPKKPAAPTGGGPKKGGAKRTKKSITAAATKPKQPKSIKSPAAKRAKRATAS